MSRFLLLFVFLIWMAWRSEPATPAKVYALDQALFFATYGLLVVGLGMWSRMLAHRVRAQSLRRGLRYFRRVVFAAQMFVPVWFAVGVFFLGWGDVVQRLLGRVGHWPVQLPGTIIGVIPPVLALMGLWWAQYPADRALREQDLLVRIDQDLPIYTSPPLKHYALQNFRLQILFTSVPILLILLAHDVFMLLLAGAFRMNLEGSFVEGIVTFASAITIFIISPMVLWRILGAHPMPPSPLRERMEAMCKSHRLRFRDILLWPTHNRIANALVMGITPRFRYVLMSDLLLSEMSDEQIEAVFAHELGHVAHRHMIWYLVFMKVLILLMLIATLLIEAAERHWLKLPAWVPMNLVMTLAGFGGFLVCFGYVSRRFERQADVFAARTLQKMGEGTGWFSAQTNPDNPATAFVAQGLVKATPSQEQRRSAVGPYGATVFASALERVAVINNMPIGSQRRWEGSFAQRVGCLVERGSDLANNWLHGSIATRMHALRSMSADPAHTRRFDRGMARLYVGLLMALIVGGALAWIATIMNSTV